MEKFAESKRLLVIYFNPADDDSVSTLSPMLTTKIGRNLPKLPKGFDYRLALAPMATSRDLQNTPRHRWFYFSHSYSHRLVETILDEWNLPNNGRLVDNFVGSGTTLLVAQNRGLEAIGYDLSSLAVTIANAKTADYSADELKQAFNKILIHPHKPAPDPDIPKRLRDAFSHQEFKELCRIFDGAQQLTAPNDNFFRLAALSTAYEFSRAVSDGGWLRWKDAPDRGHEVISVFRNRVTRMLSDVDSTQPPTTPGPSLAHLGDARCLPLDANSADAVLTSPPYPNRHDYSRVFHIGLLLLGTSESDIKSLRYKSLRSHVEAKAPDRYRDRLVGYVVPPSVAKAAENLPHDIDNRVRRMIHGYFEDIFLSLQEAARILRPGGHLAYVVGNVRHGGVPIPVDEAISEIACTVGLAFDAAWVLRLRGNSAQQMGRFGREPSRESVVMLSKA